MRSRQSDFPLERAFFARPASKIRVPLVARDIHLSRRVNVLRLVLKPSVGSKTPLSSGVDFAQNRVSEEVLFLTRAIGVVVALIVLCSGWTNYRVQAATLKLNVHDENGKPIPCRVSIRPAQGEPIVPEGAVTLPIGNDVWFYSSGNANVDVPPGSVEIRAERGIEYERVKTSIEVGDGTNLSVVVLRRWIDMRSRGYLCGENHLLIDADPLAAMLVGEGLDFGSMIQWWNNRLKTAPRGSGAIRNLEFAGRAVPTSIFDAEVEHAWGVACLQNLPTSLPFENEPGASNLAIVRHARQAGAVISYQGGYSPQVALDALLGYVDIVHVCNNNFHMHRFQPRRRYSNLLSIPDFPEYENSAEGMMRLNTESYYRLLNWGLKLGAGAGTSAGVKQVPVGYNRAYVRCDANDSIGDFYDAWAKGKNFVTNGPMLFLQTADGRRPGDTIDLAGNARHVPIRARVHSDQPLTSVELIVNGNVVHRHEPKQANEAEFASRVAVPEGGWLCARCTARDDLLSDKELGAYANGKSQQPSRLRFAHTSPIYVTVDGKAAAVQSSVNEGLQMLEALRAFSRKHATAESLPPIMDAISEAESKLRKRLSE